jgi:secreted trypsin-like serine protease
MCSIRNIPVLLVGILLYFTCISCRDNATSSEQVDETEAATEAAPAQEPSFAQYPGLEQEKVKSPEVSGGRPLVDMIEAPWQVAILYKNSVKCGGSIIAPSWIVTACHCVRESTNGQKIAKKDFQIYHSTHNLEGEYEISNLVGVDSIFENNAYNHDSLYNDIALIKLQYPLRLKNPYPRAIYLPNGKANNNDWHSVAKPTITGWGITPESSLRSKKLLIAQVNMIESHKCVTFYEKGILHVKQKMICAGDENGISGGCIGDSGCPLVYKDSLIGICSWGGADCGIKPNFTVFTDVNSYISWIDSTMNKNTSLFDKIFKEFYFN